MNGAFLNKLTKLEAKQALYREDGKWYHNLKKFPGVLFDKNGYILFNAEDDYLNTPSLQIKKDLHIIDGIQSLGGYKYFTEGEINLIYGIDISSGNNKGAVEETIRILREVDVILRKRSLVDRLKSIYKNTCQICGTQLSIGKNRYYSEVHHIVPLGYPHNGVDRLDNMVCVCPNHHAQLDLLAIPLEKRSLKIIRHSISLESIEYHNILFYGNIQ